MESTINITNQDISNLMVAALEGGINYWCGKVEMKKDKIGGGYEGVSLKDEEKLEYASDIIGIGGTLILTDAENPDEKWELNKEKFINGLKKTLEWGEYGCVEELMNNHDAETADILIQFALFNKIIFG